MIDQWSKLAFADIFATTKPNYMFQRIQTIYLTVALIAIVASYFLPFGTIGDMAIRSYGVKSVDGIYLTSVSSYWFHLPLALVMVINSYAIAQFKNRARQMAYLRLTFILFAGTFALLTLYMSEVKSFYTGVVLTPGIATFLPFVALLCNWLALRAIRKDEELVRSVNRVR